VAVAVSLILIPLGSAFGLAAFSVYTATAGTAVAFTLGMAIWLVVMQWTSSAIGGYIAGRLRVKWAELHSDEVFFRDTAHGFIAWAVATIVTVGLVVGFTASTVQTGSASAVAGATSASMDYYSDSLFRGATTPSADVTAEASRILVNDFATGTVSADDRAYLSHQVATRTGLLLPQAEARVNAVLDDVAAEKAKAAQAAETARKTLASFFTALFVSLLVGAFIASVSAALGGRLRDTY
jgi:hypothetical protein